MPAIKCLKCGFVPDDLITLYQHVVMLPSCLIAYTNENCYNPIDMLRIYYRKVPIIKATSRDESITVIGELTEVVLHEDAPFDAYYTVKMNAVSAEITFEYVEWVINEVDINV